MTIKRFEVRIAGSWYRAIRAEELKLGRLEYTLRDGSQAIAAAGEWRAREIEV